MEFDLRACDSSSEWDDFVNNSPQGSVFCQSWFLDALAVDYCRWLLCEGGIPVAAALVLERDGAPLNAPHAFSAYQGILLAGTSDAMPRHRRSRWILAVMTALVERLVEVYARLSFCTHPALDDLRALQWFHYKKPELGRFRFDLAYTGLIKLGAESCLDDFLPRIRKVRRYEYRAALRAEMTVAGSRDVGTLDRLHALTFRRQSLVRTPREVQLLKSIARAALDNNAGELLVCSDADGHATAATLFLYDRVCGYYLFGANDPARRVEHGGTLLFLENLRRCIERRCQHVDVVGINSPNRGDFKTSFDAVPRPYFVVNWDRPPVAAAAGDALDQPSG